MENAYSQIQELLHRKADFQARLNLIPYDGNPEIKEKDGQKYLYVRKRVGSRLQECELCAIGAQGVRAADCKKTVKKPQGGFLNRSPSRGQ